MSFPLDCASPAWLRGRVLRLKQCVTWRVLRTGRVRLAGLLSTPGVPTDMGCADSYPSSLLQNHTRTVVLRWKWTAKEGDVSGCYGDSCDVLRFNEVFNVE